MKHPLPPRQKRALMALLNGPMMREYLGQIVGCSNAPELIAVLRRKGLSIPCELVEKFDKDANVCRPGLSNGFEKFPQFPKKDRRKVSS